jgi:hypothetical protein
MNDYMLLMHNDGKPSPDDAWGPYLSKLKASGRFQGGSSMGTGACFNKAGTRVEIAAHLGGYIKVQAESLEEARKFLEGNPVYEHGGTVEIRELPAT